jgi:hypothetical protein
MVCGGFEVFTAVAMKSSVFWDMSYNLVKVNQHFLVGLLFNHENGLSVNFHPTKWHYIAEDRIICGKQCFITHCTLISHCMMFASLRRWRTI